MWLLCRGPRGIGAWTTYCQAPANLNNVRGPTSWKMISVVLPFVTIYVKCELLTCFLAINSSELLCRRWVCRDKLSAHDECEGVEMQER